jgi:hypothetical protein
LNMRRNQHRHCRKRPGHRFCHPCENGPGHS